MKIVIGESTYTKFSDLVFLPEVDITGNSLPINEFSANIRTEDAIPMNATAILYDDSDTMWASYTIVDAWVTQPGEKRIVAQSAIALLNKRKMAHKLYSGAALSSVLAEIFDGFPSGAYSVDSSFSNVEISGYCPDQTARERLQWVCFVIGAYVRAYFSATIQILALSNTATVVPLNKTYWKPQANVSDYVTKVTLRTYAYTAGTPARTDDYVEYGGNYYIQTTQDFSLTNDSVPQYVMENEIVVTGVSIINTSNVSAILSRLANAYFKRGELEASVIDNGEYYPGQKLEIYTAEDGMKSGYCVAAEFSFGFQSKAKLTLTMTEDVETLCLTIRAMFDGTQVGLQKYYLPAGYSYEIENPFVDIVLNGSRYILRPDNPTTSGTMPSTSKTVEEDYSVALQFMSGQVLYIVSVDDVEQNDEIVRIS